jgi:uncharacterized protein (DUF111 family)
LSAFHCQPSPASELQAGDSKSSLFFLAYAAEQILSFLMAMIPFRCFFCYHFLEVIVMEFGHRDEHVDKDMLIMQANIDDMNPEWTSYITDQLFAGGANDVYWIPIIMKKGRPGIMLNVLVDESHLGEMESIIFSETTTLGIRYLHASCHRLAREFVTVTTKWGPATVKVGYHQGRRVQMAPEFKECEQIAKAYQVPLKEVYEEVRRAASSLA